MTATRAGFVAVIGRPNVGKSTLTNLLVGEKVAIVSNVPQTTRRRVRGILNLPGGQIVFVDTPGIHKPHHRMNQVMVSDATAAMSEVDVVLFLIEAAEGLGPGDRFILARLPEHIPVLLVINKIDTVRKTALLPLIDRVKGEHPFAEILLVSALTGQNTEGIAGKLLAYLPEGPPLFPGEDYTDQHERAIASEIVREKILHHTRQEIPHETCVLIDLFEETEGSRRIEATILVDKESQKKILIGREGSMLKQIGTEARLELEEILGSRVVLKLWVKVHPGWRDDERILAQLGLTSR